MNVFQRIFRKTEPARAERAEMLNGQIVQFSAWSGDAYSSDIFRAGVDAIARNAGKLKGGHVIKSEGDIKANADGRLDRLLQVQPNPLMNAYDLLYKIVTHTYLYNNGFAYLDRDVIGNIIGIYPIMGANAEFLADPSGAMYCRFLFRSGKSATLPYKDIIHIRRHFNSNDMFGDPNGAILPALELAHAQNEGIMSGIRNGANIRGILRYAQLLSPEKLKGEFEVSASVIETVTGRRPIAISYPFGKNNETVRTIAAETYRYGVTTKSGVYTEVSDKLGLGRLRVSRGMTMAQFKAMVG